MRRGFFAFLDFISWNIMAPLAIPMGAIFLMCKIFGEKFSFSNVLCVPDFLLIAIALSGESNGELRTFPRPQEKILDFFWKFCNRGFIFILVTAGCTYGIALYATYEGRTLYVPGWNAFLIGFSILLAVFSWFAFNHSRNNNNHVQEM